MRLNTFECHQGNQWPIGPSVVEFLALPVFSGASSERSERRAGKLLATSLIRRKSHVVGP